ncbi:enoyl-CoA hydratase/isomerase family protein [Streptomyces rubiginosohelvolus]|uniref:Enoyl-CoA hydratase/isomerase family protein n=1 Tax=Streptomyces rubiginosohelvolus TaxID=67362 RepID=A0ABW6ETJ8_9ACTN
MTTIGDRLHVTEVSPEYWRVAIDNAPLNLFDARMFAAFNVLMDRIESDGNLKVVVLESTNPDYFVAHYDLGYEEAPDVPGAADFTDWPRFVTRLAQSSVISVAKLRGRARGHGSELALACDIRFASREKAVLSQIEVGSSVVPGGGATEWLSALVGRSRALEIIAGADDFDADTAERYGWVNRAVPDGELDDFVHNFAHRIAGFDKQPLGLAKHLVNARAGVPSEADRWASNHAFLTTTTWPATQERVAELVVAGLQQEGDFELRLGHHLGNHDKS